MQAGTGSNFYFLGIGIVVALVIGGGTVAGLWTDSLVQLILLAAAIPVLVVPGSPIARNVLWFVGFCAAVMLVQAVPLPQGIVAPHRPTVFILPQSMEDEPLFISVLLGQTVTRIIYTFVLFVVFIAMLRLRRSQLYFLSIFFFAGLVFNLVLAFFQFSAASSVDLSAYAAYEMLAGAFANRNHLATLLYTSIPFGVYFFVDHRYRLWAGLGLAGVLLILLATGSRAGAAIAVLAMLSSFIVLVAQGEAASGKSNWRVVLAMGANLAFLGFGVAGLLAQRGAVPDAMRLEMAETTLSAIQDNWRLGTGFGTFQQVYQIYEPTSSLGFEFVNHAHNDYLELVLEGGVLTAVALVSYLLLLTRRIFLVRLNGFQKAAGLSLFFILLHSVVDYPLRTMAIGVVFVYLNAVLFHASRDHLERARRARESGFGARPPA